VTFIMKQNHNGSVGEEWPDDGRSETFLNLEEAATFVGVSAPILSSLLKQYGVGRYHVNRTHDQIVYSFRDLAHMKNAMKQSATADAVKN